MSHQVKVPTDVKRELELCAAISGQTQGELLAAAWHEYREHHKGDFKQGLVWAQSVLGDDQAAAVAASGMSDEDLGEIAEALGDTTGQRGKEQRRAVRRCAALARPPALPDSKG